MLKQIKYLIKKIREKWHIDLSRILEASNKNDQKIYEIQQQILQQIQKQEKHGHEIKKVQELLEENKKMINQILNAIDSGQYEAERKITLLSNQIENIEKSYENRIKTITQQNNTALENAIAYDVKQIVYASIHPNFVEKIRKENKIIEANSISDIVIPQADFTKLSLVEIEVFSYCNRRCWFCPNAEIDRHSKNIYMKENLYLKILDELRSIRFKGELTFSRYNEPLADRIILKRIEQAREFLPDAYLHTNTNGDYITKEYLNELSDAGLNSLNIQCYLQEGEIFNIDGIKLSINEMSKKLGLKFHETECNISYYEVELHYEKMKIKMYARDFLITGNTRGGSVKTINPVINRKEPCIVPFEQIYIDYNGSVMPCCNFRSDVKEHQNFVMGNVATDTLEHIFNNERYRKLREEVGQSPVSLYPCNTCNFALKNDQILESRIPE